MQIKLIHLELCVKFWCKDDIQFQFLSGAAEQGREAAERSSEQSNGGDAHAGAHNLQQVWKEWEDHAAPMYLHHNMLQEEQD